MRVGRVLLAVSLICFLATMTLYSRLPQLLPESSHHSESSSINESPLSLIIESSPPTMNESSLTLMLPELRDAPSPPTPPSPPLPPPAFTILVEFSCKEPRASQATLRGLTQQSIFGQNLSVFMCVPRSEIIAPLESCQSNVLAPFIAPDSLWSFDTQLIVDVVLLSAIRSEFVFISTAGFSFSSVSPPFCLEEAYTSMQVLAVDVGLWSGNDGEGGASDSSFVAVILRVEAVSPLVSSFTLPLWSAKKIMGLVEYLRPKLSVRTLHLNRRGCVLDHTVPIDPLQILTAPATWLNLRNVPFAPRGFLSSATSTTTDVQSSDLDSGVEVLPSMLSVVILIRTPEELLELPECLSRLGKQTLKSFDVVLYLYHTFSVVTLDLEETYKLCDSVSVTCTIVKALLGRDNRGNLEQAAFAAESDYVFRTDTSMILEPTALEMAYWALESNPKAACILPANFEPFSVLFHSPPSLIAAAYRRLLIPTDAYATQTVGGEDWGLLLHILASEHPCVRIRASFGDQLRPSHALSLREQETLLESLRISIPHVFEPFFVPVRSTNIHEEYGEIPLELHAGHWEVYGQFGNPANLYPRVVSLSATTNPTPSPSSGSVRSNSTTEEEDHEPTKGVKQKRLLMIIPFMIVGGADLFHLHVAEAFVRRGYHVTVACTVAAPKTLLPQFLNATTDLFVLPEFVSTASAQAGFLVYLMRSRLSDIVMVGNSELGYLTLPLLRAYSAETGDHRVAFVDYNHMEAPGWMRGGYCRYSGMYQEYLDGTMTASNYLADWMAQHVAGVQRERLAACYIGTDTDMYAPSPQLRASIRSGLGINETTLVLMYACRMSEQKQPLVFAEIILQLSRDPLFVASHQLEVFVVGDGSLLNDMKERLTVLQDHPAIHMRYFGEVSELRVRDLMTASDVFILPSLLEGLALVMLEAMSTELVFVGANVGGHSEVITPACNCGVLVERSSSTATEVKQYVEALLTVFTDPDLRRTMGRNARQVIVDKFQQYKLGECLEQNFEQAQKRRSNDVASYSQQSRESARWMVTLGLEYYVHVRQSIGVGDPEK